MRPREEVPIRRSIAHAAQHDAVVAVLRAFGVGEPSSLEPAGGTASPKWAIDSDRGRFVVRVRPSEFTDIRAVRFDHEALLCLSRAGLPVPTPLRRPDGTTWLCQDGKHYEVLSWVDGEPFRDGDLDAIAGLGTFLARFHSAIGTIPAGKEGILREDHPDLLEPYLARLRRLASTSAHHDQLDRVERELNTVRHRLAPALVDSLPRCVIHGDVHPGNVRFRGSEVAAVYDFDYLSVQARARDVADGLIFFAARRRAVLDPCSIRSLTQPFVLAAERCRILLRAYQRANCLTEQEWHALPLLIRSRWIQMRLRGLRKLEPRDGLEFVLDGFFEVIDWLDGESPAFFKRLRKET